jgi:copper resistance protein B
MRPALLAAALALSAGAASAQTAPPPHHEHASPAPAPAPAAGAPRADDWAADRYYDPKEMAQARQALKAGHGGETFAMSFINLAEYQFRPGGGGYLWDAEASWGGDIQRLVLKTEGEGPHDGGVDDAEVQALYSRAITPYYNLRAGVRQDLTGPERTYATAGVEGTAPYFIDTEVAAFLSNRGELLVRATASYDLRITQRLILQPRADADLAAQSRRSTGEGSGLANLELALRLRYDITRQFAPYVGLIWSRSFGDTARYLRADGERVEQSSLAVGLRAEF